MRPRQLCHDKDFNVATNSSTSDQDQRRLGRDKEKVCHSIRNSVTTKDEKNHKKNVTTLFTMSRHKRKQKTQKLCHDTKILCRDIK